MGVEELQRIARQLMEIGVGAKNGDGHLVALAYIVEQLRLVWNARGAADLAKIEAELFSSMGAAQAGPYVTQLRAALRSLDRESGVPCG